MQLTCILDNFVCSRMTKFGQDFNGNQEKMIKIFANEQHKSAKNWGKFPHFAGGAEKFDKMEPKIAKGAQHKLKIVVLCAVEIL